MAGTMQYQKGFVISADGTKIGYRQTGNGKGLILVHGGLMASQNFTQLAQALSNEYTVYIPDRRGRGLSNENVNNRGLKFEGDDINALANQTGAELIFGLSSGAISTLQAIVAGSNLKKVVLYEPLISINGSNALSNVKSYDDAILKKNYGKAFISIVKATDGSSFLGMLPAFISAPLMSLAIKSEAKKNNGEDVPLQKLVAEWGYDRDITLASDGMIEKCKNITQQILLLSGQKSQSFFKTALNALSSALPNAKWIELPGLGHLGPDNTEHPEVVAEALRKFFAEN